MALTVLPLDLARWDEAGRDCLVLPVLPPVVPPEPLPVAVPTGLPVAPPAALPVGLPEPLPVAVARPVPGDCTGGEAGVGTVCLGMVGVSP